MEAAEGDMFCGSRDAGAGAATCRCGGVACNLHNMEKALRGTFLDIHNSNESTIHPASGLLKQALRSLSGSTHMVQPILASGDYTTEPYAQMLHCWASELEKDAEMMCQGEKGRKYIFLLNNIYDVLQMMRRPGATFANAELVRRLNSLIQHYNQSYIDECWVPLLRLNFDEFTAQFIATCDNQREWKVTAELKYKLRQQIVDLIVPAYEASLSNRSRLSRVLCPFKRVTAGNKKQKKYTGEELKEEIRVLFEG